jgi:hypothetical protein
MATVLVAGRVGLCADYARYQLLPVVFFNLCICYVGSASYELTAM